MTATEEVVRRTRTEGSILLLAVADAAVGEVDAPVTRREIQRRERDGRIEMERRERHMQNEFKEMHYSYQVR